MQTDVFFADQSCYIDDVNRSHAVCFGLSNAKKIFERTFRFQHRFQLEQEGKSIREAIGSGKSILDDDFPAFPPFQMQSIKERVIDNFLIGTFFEIVAKIILLDKGFVVHEINSRTKNKDIKALGHSQKISPIKIQDLLQYDHFEDYEGIGRNGLQSLQFKTIGYEKLYENNYERNLSFLPKIVSLARYYRVERNMIHFPLAGASENQITNKEFENVKNLNHIEIITSFIKTELIPLFETRKKEFNFSNWEI